ncbi:TonB-dependent siderophore receptor [Bradyrhizobium sp.]|uniref:TonB-dependent siderophore receptor n=1 Tax=Bradyrhizobium sp. TaxID=376 RepID=UPI0039B94735
MLPRPAPASRAKPTTSQQYEGGVKFQPARNVLLTVAVYDLTQQNVLTQDPSHSDYKVQIGEVNSRGFEAEVIAEFLPGLNVIASYTQQVVRVTQNNDGYTGKAPVLVPGTTASAYADYTLQSGALANFGFGAGIRHNGKTFSDQANTIVNPDYATFDAGLHYKMDNGVTLALNVKNIGDTVRTACTDRAAANTRLHAW